MKNSSRKFSVKLIKTTFAKGLKKTLNKYFVQEVKIIQIII